MTLRNIEMAQLQFYGFTWMHPLERCSVAQGLSFENYRQQGYSYEQRDIGPVEGVIQANRELISKKSKAKYRQLVLLDINWEFYDVIVWGDDYERWKEDLQVGSLVRLRLTAPNPVFSNQKYTLESYPKWRPHLIPVKEQDFRVVRLDKFLDTNADIGQPEDDFSRDLIAKSQTKYFEGGLCLKD